MAEEDAQQRRSDGDELSDFLPSNEPEGSRCDGPPSSLSHVAAGVSLGTTTLNLESEVLELRRVLISRDAELRESQWAKEQAEGSVRRCQQELHGLQAKEQRQAEEINSLRVQLSQREEQRRSEAQRREELESTLSLEREGNNARMTALRNEVEALQDEISRQASDFARESASVVSDMALAEKKFISLQFSHTQLKAAYDETLEQNQTLLKQLTELRADLAERDNALHKQTSALTQATGERSRLQEQVEQLQMELNNLRRETQPYSRRSVLLSDALRTAESSRSEVQSLKERCEYLEAQNEAFRQRHHRASTNDEQLLTEVEEARTRIVSLERSLAVSNRAVEALEARAKSLEEELAQSKHETARIKRFKETLEDQATSLLRNAQGLGGRNPRDMLQELVELKEALRVTEEKSAAALEQQGREMAEKLKDMEETVSEHNSHKTLIIQELSQQQAVLRTRCEEYMQRIGTLEADLARHAASERRVTTELQSLQDERNRLQQRLESASNQVKQCHEQTQEAQSEKLQLAMVIAMKDSQITFLQSQYDKEAERSSRLLKDVEEAAAGRQSVQMELIEARKQLQEAVARREAVEVELTQKKTELHQLESAKSFVEQEARSLREEIVSEGKRYNEGRRLLDEQAVKLEGWLRQTQSENASLRETLKEKDMELTRRTETLQVREMELHKTTQALEVVKGELQSAQLKHTELEKEFSAVRAETLEKERQMLNLRKDFHSLYELSNIAANSGNNTPRTSIEMAASGTPGPTSKRPSVAPVSTILDPSQPTVSITAGEKLIEALRQEVDDRDRRIKNLEAAYNELETEVEKVMKPQIDRLKEELETADKKLEVAHGSVAELERQLQQEGKNSHSLRTRIEELEEAKKAAETKILEMEGRLQEAKQKLEEVANNTRRTEEELETARNSYRAVVQAHAADMQQVESNSAERARLLDSIEEARKEVDNINKDRTRERLEFERFMSKARSDHAALQKAYDELQQEFNTLAPKLLMAESHSDGNTTETVLQIQCSQAIRQRDSLATEVEALKIDAAQLRARNNAVEATLEQMRSQLNESNKKMGELRRKMAAQASMYAPDVLLERATLQKQVEEVEADKAALEDKYNRLESALQEERAAQEPLRTQLTQKESELRIMKTQILKLQKGMDMLNEQYQITLASHKLTAPPPEKVKIPEQAVKDLLHILRRSVRYALLGSLMIRVRPGALEQGAANILAPSVGDLGNRKRPRSDDDADLLNPTPKQLVKRPTGGEVGNDIQATNDPSRPQPVAVAATPSGGPTHQGAASETA